MASKGPKAASLSRYFKDLDEFECNSDESVDEIDSSVEICDDKIRKFATQESGTSVSSISKPEESKVDAQNRPPPVATSSTSPTDNYADTKIDVVTVTDSSITKVKLPSASECLNTRSSPAFLKISQKKEVNWDACQKRLEGDNDEDAVLNYKSNSVPPPASYEPITDPGIKVVDSEGRKRKTIGDDLEDQMTSSRAYKVHKDDNDAENDDS